MIRFKFSGTNHLIQNTIKKKLKENCVCDFNDTTFDIEIITLEGNEGPKFDIKDSVATIITTQAYDSDKFVNDFLDFLFKRFKIESLNFDFDIKTVSDEEDKEIRLSANYDKINNTLSRGIDDKIISVDTAKRALPSTGYYVARTITGPSIVYTGPSLNKAITECDKYAAFKVFDYNGRVIYTSKKNKTVINDKEKIINKETTAIIRTGHGIKLNNRHIPDGTKVIITKRSNKKSEIIIHLDGERIIAEVLNEVLSLM